MGRYRASVVSSAAATSGTVLMSMVAGSTGDFFIRRVTVGFTSGGTTPTSEQVQVNATAGTGLTAPTPLTPGTALLRSTSRPALVIPCTAATGTFTAVGAPFILPLNTQSAADIPWEQLEEWQVPPSSSLQFTTQTTLPASTSICLSVEWEE